MGAPKSPLYFKERGGKELTNVEKAVGLTDRNWDRWSRNTVNQSTVTQQGESPRIYPITSVILISPSGSSEAREPHTTHIGQPSGEQ